MAVALYTSRVVLHVLGIDDYGIYSVVGGFVGMFSLISASLTASTQRFITFELGKKSDGHSQEVFSAALTIHFLIAIVVLILAESVGLWFLNEKMIIPVERLSAANWVFQFSLFTFIVNLISVPYNSAIVAHEKMTAFAYISLIEAFLRLVIVFVLTWLSFDKLVVYGFLMLIVAVIIRIIYGFYCSRQFSETKFIIVRDKAYYQQMLGFSGWNILGSSAGVLTNYGINVLMNLFFSVVVNAARGIASQVDSAVNQFVGNFTMAINPQIIKSYAAGDNSYMMRLVMRGSRYSYYLLLIMAMPLLLETEILLKIWLGTVPAATIIFVRLTLIYSLCQSISNTLYTAMLATGKIRNYQIIVGGLALMAFPLAYMFYKVGFPPEFGYVATIITSIICLIARLYLLKEMVKLSIRAFFKDVLISIIIVTIIAFLIPIISRTILEPGVTRLFVVLGVSIASTILSILLFGISSEERSTLISIIKNKHGR